MVREKGSVTAARAFGYFLETSPASHKSAASVVTRLDQAGLVSEDDGLGPVAEAELGEQVSEVRLHRRFTEEQRAGDLLVGSAPGDGGTTSSPSVST
jgi:hypothetical protein